MNVSFYQFIFIFSCTDLWLCWNVYTRGVTRVGVTQYSYSCCPPITTYNKDLHCVCQCGRSCCQFLMTYNVDLLRVYWYQITGTYSSLIFDITPSGGYTCYCQHPSSPRGTPLIYTCKWQTIEVAKYLYKLRKYEHKKANYLFLMFAETLYESV